MRFPLLLSIALLTLPGCGKHAETSSLAVPAAAVQGQSSGEKRAARSPSIAYERSRHLDVHEDKIGSVYEAVQAACREATADQCVLLEIRSNKELAQVQNDIEARDGEMARLRQRVETGILHVHLDAVHHRPFMRPVSRALAHFTSHLSEGLSSAITGLAYVIPWSITLFVFAWSAGRLWGRSKRARARHDLGREDR